VKILANVSPVARADLYFPGNPVLKSIGARCDLALEIMRGIICTMLYLRLSRVIHASKATA
jgi:hypothetical protein